VATPTVYYDGACGFCQAQMRNLSWFLPKGRYQALPNPDPEARALEYSDARGRRYTGAEAVVRALALRSIGRVAFLYYIPGFRQLCDAIYRLVARHRYAIGGRSCAIDGGPRRPPA
jgi:predicted DCC family thiol-disulfide oxidoreductase YuxK